MKRIFYIIILSFLCYYSVYSQNITNVINYYNYLINKLSITDEKFVSLRNKIEYLAKSNWGILGTDDTNGVNGPVRALAIYNNELYVGGSFTKAGNVMVNNIARWDGKEWKSVGTGDNNGVKSNLTDIPPVVASLCVYNGELYVGGIFTKAGSSDVNNLARWDGTNWKTVGSATSNGVFSNISNIPAIVSAMQVFNNELYIGGFFTEAGGQSANSIVRWNGNSFKVLGLGPINGIIGGLVTSLCIFKNELIIGGYFTQATIVSVNNIAKWNGLTFSSLGAGSDNGVSGKDALVLSLATFNNNLYVGGNFTKAGAKDIYKIAQWNGTKWNNVGNGIDTNTTSSVTAMSVYNNKLFVGGIFTKADSLDVLNIAYWDTQKWHSLDTVLYAGVIGSVGALLNYQNELIVAGLFTHAGNKRVNNIAKWNNSTPTKINDVKLLPDEFILFQNYPNPFNSSTKIPFRINQKTFIQIKIYDLIGREITTLLTSTLNAGYYSINFDASLLPAGAYICIMQNDIQTKVIKLLYLK